MLLSVFADLWLFGRIFAFPAILISAGVVYLVKTTPATVRGEYRVVTLDELLGPRVGPMVTVLSPETVQAVPEVEPTVVEVVVGVAAEPSTTLNPFPGRASKPTATPAVKKAASRKPKAPVLGLPETVAVTQVASGLGWEQFAALCGVSRSTARSWANGGKPSAANRRRLDRVITVVGGFDGTSGERLARWDTRVDGVTLFDRTRTMNLNEGKVAA